MNVKTKHRKNIIKAYTYIYIDKVFVYIYIINIYLHAHIHKQPTLNKKKITYSIEIWQIFLN